MGIEGFQEFTLIDYPGKFACTIFFGGCNFRCGYCHNSELVLGKRQASHTQEEIFKFLEQQQGKLEGVCISGGEPTLQRGLEKFIRRIKEREFSIKLDTNGSHPEVLQELNNQGLIDYIAMDVKSGKERYKEIVGAQLDTKKVEESMRVVSKLPDYEFRTTVVKRYHDAEEIERIAGWVNSVCGKKPKRYFLQGFKRQENLIDSSFTKEENVGADYLRQLKEVAIPYFKSVEIRGE
ncbi:MAG: anaerobic ribonucleoside-triphosphate reductase activating protein [Nanoarchaeota archaeon]|nr:anaerobic ribonucleoside-triphosphate reductase activating protein [Nanoarchaeota archaeon]